MSTVRLGYWIHRGRGQIPRLLLSYTLGAQWEDYTYPYGPKWLNEDQNSIGLDFPNLPYLIEGDLKITESSAIERYIC